MPSRHSRTGPSSAERWVHCPPSLRLGEEYGAQDTGSVYAAEGTEAHELGEFLLRQALGEAMEDPRPAMQFYNEEIHYFDGTALGFIPRWCRKGMVIIWITANTKRAPLTRSAP